MSERHRAEFTLKWPDVYVPLIVNYQARTLHEGLVTSMPMTVHVLTSKHYVLPAIGPTEVLAVIFGYDLLVGRAWYTFKTSIGRTASDRYLCFHFFSGLTRLLCQMLVPIKFPENAPGTTKCAEIGGSEDVLGLALSCFV